MNTDCYPLDPSMLMAFPCRFRSRKKRLVKKFRKLYGFLYKNYQAGNRYVYRIVMDESCPISAEVWESCLTLSNLQPPNTVIIDTNDNA
jgi:hypothetical protein